MAFCGEHTLQAKEGDFHAVAHLKCRRWSCPTCGPMRAAALRTQAWKGKPQAFITLTTMRRPDASPVREAARQSAAWVKLRRLTIIKYGLESLPFFAVRERHKSGWPHLHILIRGPFIDQAWLSNQWKRLTGSPVVHIRQVTNSAKAAAYISKYIGKEPAKFGMLKRYWCSQDWSDAKEFKKRRMAQLGGRWRCEKEPYAAALHRLTCSGFHPVYVRDRMQVFAPRWITSWPGAP